MKTTQAHIAGAAIAAGCLMAAHANADDKSGTAKDKPIQSMRIDLDAARATEGGCRYLASIHGDITPVKAESSGNAKQEPEVNPNIDVAARVTCPTSSELKITDNIMATGPLTRAKLESALERRASVVSESASKRCVYVPDFAFKGDRLELIGVSASCAKPAK